MSIWRICKKCGGMYNWLLGCSYCELNKELLSKGKDVIKDFDSSKSIKVKPKRKIK